MQRWLLAIGIGLATFGGPLVADEDEAAGPETRLDPSQLITVSFAPTVAERFELGNADAGPKLDCSKRTEKAVIDGAPDEPQWEGGASIARFSPDGPRTSARVYYTDESLFIAVRCEPRGGDSIQATKTPPNTGKPWQDDNVELDFVIPGESEPTAFQFIVNAAGSVYAISSKSGMDPDSGSRFDASWSAAARVEGTSWTAELAIPLAALGLEAWPDRLRFNIGRAGPAGFAAQAWGGEWGHLGAGALVFEGVAPTPPGAKSRSARKRNLLTASSEGEGLDVAIERPIARPGDRWIDGEFALAPEVALEQARLLFELRAHADDRVIAAREVVPERGFGRFGVDLRTPKLSGAQLVVRLLEGGQQTAISRSLLTAEQAAVPAGSRIPLKVDAAQETGVVTDTPVRFGVPFPEGVLWDAGAARLIDASGREVPSQREVANRWARDGAIKWLLFDAQVSSSETYAVEFKGTVAPPSPAQKPPALSIKETNSGLAIDTGAARYVLGRGVSPIREIWVGQRKVADGAQTRGLYVIDQTGRVGSAADDEAKMQIEAAGPLAACVRFEGFYRDSGGKQMARHITRVELFAGHPHARVTHTLILTNDTNEVWLKEIGWELATPASAEGRRGAVFAVERARPDETLSVELGDKIPSAHMIQESHYRFLGGENRYTVNATDAAKGTTQMRSGDECGDWAALVDEDGGLLLGCRESARTHPKEFEVATGKITLKLFSGRAGEELDFRAKTLVKKWNLRHFAELCEPVILGIGGQTADSAVEKASALPSNAIGWAKTHELIISPLPAEDPARSAARIAGPLTFPVYVHVNPSWICESGVFGPLHPKDSERFPMPERVLAGAIQAYDDRDSHTGMYGFVDYGTGPLPFRLRGDPKAGEMGRYKTTYNLRRDLLLLAARSGERSVRDFAERSNRAAADLYFAHWDGPWRVRGGWIVPSGVDNVVADPFNLPMTWEGATRFDTGATSEPENEMILYYMSGNRRAKEVALAYFDALKAAWSPHFIRNAFFVERNLAIVTLGYEFTQDPDFADLSRATIDILDDPEASLGFGVVTYAPSYKVVQDIQYTIKADRTHTDPRLGEWARVRSRHLVDKHLTDLIYYQSNKGLVSSYLYRQTGDAYIAEELDMFLRQLGLFYDPQKDEMIDYSTMLLSGARVGAIMNGVAYGEDAVARSGADRRSVASWVGASFPHEPETLQPIARPGCIYVQKPVKVSLDLRVYSYGIASKGEVQLKLEGAQPGTWATDLNRLTTMVDGHVSRFELEKFAPAGDYQVSGGAVQYVIANSRVPMVLYAPTPWTPYPNQRPWVPIYFKVPEGTANGLITFEGSALLHDPAGEPFGDGQPVKGEVKLPADRPGLWSFVPVENKSVSVKNIPPFFAFRDPAYYFEPEIAATPGDAVGEKPR